MHNYYDQQHDRLTRVQDALNGVADLLVEFEGANLLYSQDEEAQELCKTFDDLWDQLRDYKEALQPLRARSSAG